MSEKTPSTEDAATHRAEHRGVTAEVVAALLVTLVAGFLFLNGSLFSSVSSSDPDFSINWVAAHALWHGESPYGVTTLAERARSLDAPTELLYGQLYTSYIQPPTSALSILPLTLLPWRHATRAWLLINHLFLISAVVITLATVRPSLPRHWVAAGVAVLLLVFSEIYGSFALGQVDATQVLLLSVGFWGYVNKKAPVTGIAIALGAAIKLIPGLLLLYMLWRREYRTVAWGVGAGLVLLLASLPFTGWETYHIYLTETLPALAKGSTHYSNAGFGALIARLHTPDPYRGLPEMLYLDEVASSTVARLASLVVALAGLVALAVVIPMRRGKPASDEVRRPERLIWQYYLVIAVGLLISSVTWEFYVVWLLPVFVVAFLCFDRVLPNGTARYICLGAFALALLQLNYPGDMYLFVPNGVFYHPGWVPGVFVEDHLQLYHKHLDAVLFLRLPGLLLLAGTMAYLVRRNATETSS